MGTRLPTGRDLLQFRVGAELAPELERRAGPGLSPSLVVKRDIGRYFELLALAAAELEFAQEEIALLAAVWGARDRGTPPRLLWALLVDGDGASDLHIYGVDDVGGLAARVRDLEAGELYALVDRIERPTVLSLRSGSPAEHKRPRPHFRPPSRPTPPPREETQT